VRVARHLIPVSSLAQDLAAVRTAASATLLELDPRHHSPAAISTRSVRELQELTDRVVSESSLLRDLGVEAVGWSTVSKRVNDVMAPAYVTVDERAGKQRHRWMEQSLSLAMNGPALAQLIEGRGNTGVSEVCWGEGGGL